MSFYSYPNRLVCSVLEEMRNMLKILDHNNIDKYKSSQAMLIEETQTLVNRMEAGLEDQRDLRMAHEEIKKLKKEIKELEDKRDSLKVDVKE